MKEKRRARRGHERKGRERKRKTSSDYTPLNSLAVSSHPYSNDRLERLRSLDSFCPEVVEKGFVDGVVPDSVAESSGRGKESAPGLPLQPREASLTRKLPTSQDERVEEKSELEGKLRVAPNATNLWSIPRHSAMKDDDQLAV